MRNKEVMEIRAGNFNVEIIEEGDTPNIYVRNKPDNRLFAKIWIYPDGTIEVRRFLNGNQATHFIDEDGKIRAA